MKVMFKSLIVLTGILFEMTSFASEVVDENAKLANAYEAAHKDDDYYLVINNPFKENNEGNGTHLLKQTGYSLIAGIGAMAYLWNQPASATNWYNRDKSNLWGQYEKNVTSTPRWDNDDFFTNYIGHPLAGASYYVMCRQNAFNILPCFGYSVLMSTLYWEYGLEAVAEVPSQQDLFVTPVLGSLFGEGFHQLKQAIKRNNNSILGSRIAGRLAMYALDPLGHFTAGLNYGVEWMIAPTSKDKQSTSMSKLEETNLMVGMNFKMQF